MSRPSGRKVFESGTNLPGVGLEAPGGQVEPMRWWRFIDDGGEANGIDDGGDGSEPSSGDEGRSEWVVGGYRFVKEPCARTSKGGLIDCERCGGQGYIFVRVGFA